MGGMSPAELTWGPHCAEVFGLHCVQMVETGSAEMSSVSLSLE